MKIVVLNGSPRKEGNTRTLLKGFEKGVTDHLDVTHIDFVDLNEKKIKPCEACDACAKLKGKCIHKDDTNDLMALITDADVIVFGSPVYWWGISSQLKLIIDKFYSWHHYKYKIANKKIGLITVGGSGIENQQYQLISDQFKCISDFLKWDVVFDEAFSAYSIGDIKGNQEALVLADSLYKKL